MKTLREEIDELLYREMFEPYGISQTNFIRDGVLRIFEKRIDARIKYYNKSGGLVEQSDNLEVIEELQNIKRMLK